VVGRRATTAALQRDEALLLAMLGHIDDARTLHDEAEGVIGELGSRSGTASNVFTRANLELLAGAPERAERVARSSLAAFEAMGNRNQGSTAAAFLGVALVEQGRDDEALKYADLAGEWAVADDLTSQVTQLAVRARVLARRGELKAAERAGRDAVALSRRSDDPWLRADGLVALGVVHERAGRAEEATAALHDAVAVLERKGNVAYADRVRALMSGQTSNTPHGA
jgi:tetratricopeptide (TPR) repeat protein